MSDAQGRGGIQAYKGHSTCLRGKKIRIDYTELMQSGMTEEEQK